MSCRLDQRSQRLLLPPSPRDDLYGDDCSGPLS